MLTNYLIMVGFIIAGAVGPWQIILIVAILLLFFGGKKIPELMRGIGKGVGEFKKGMRDEEDEEKTNNELNEGKKDE